MIKIIGKLLPLIISAISPEVRDETISLVKVLDKKAKATPNPIDDVFVGILKIIINVDD